MGTGHHVRKRKQRRRERVILAIWQDKECAVRQRDADRFGLRSARLAAIAEEPAVNAGSLQTLVTKRALTIGVRKRHHDEVALLHFADFRADGFDDADRFVAHRSAGFTGC